MGFVKPKNPKTSLSTPPPVVSEMADEEVRAGYGQESAHRKGLLSTILSNRRQADSNGGETGGRSTLG